MLVVSATVAWGGAFVPSATCAEAYYVSLGLSDKEERAAPSIAPHYPMALSLAQPAPVESASHMKSWWHHCNTWHPMCHVAEIFLPGKLQVAFVFLAWFLLWFRGWVLSTSLFAKKQKCQDFQIVFLARERVPQCAKRAPRLSLLFHL